MKLSISNIAWSKEEDKEMYEYISKEGLNGIEIAPTRIINENPYSKIEKIKEYARKLKEDYKLEISSIQSIWFGKQEKIFGTNEEREELINYSKKAIDFAEAINCKNLVFGCPKNRIINNLEQDYKIALQFFYEIGNYATSKDVYFSIEANPEIYNTNFITHTEEAIKIVKELNNTGIKINLDVGTMIQNNEDVEILKGNVHLINHVHISEPNLEYIQKRKLHKELIKILKENNYERYISIEMKNKNNIDKVKEQIKYVKSLIN